MAKIVRWIVYAMLLLSAGTAFLIGDSLWAAARLGNLPIWVALVPASAFTAFVLVYALDRFLLVRRRNYPAGRAVFQTFFSVLFLMLLWPGQAAQMQAVRYDLAPEKSIVNLLNSRNPVVRAVACEVLGYRDNKAALADIHRLVENDKEEAVRQACRDALERMTDEQPPQQAGPR